MEPTSWSSSPSLLPPPPSSPSPSKESIIHHHRHHHPHHHPHHYLCWATTLCKAFDINLSLCVTIKFSQKPMLLSPCDWFPNSAVLQNDLKFFQKSRCLHFSRKLLKQGLSTGGSQAAENVFPSPTDNSTEQVNLQMTGLSNFLKVT